MGTTASSVLIGIIGVIVTIVGIVLAIYGLVDLLHMAFISGVIYLIIGAILIWVGVDVIGWPGRGGRFTSSS